MNLYNELKVQLLAIRHFENVTGVKIKFEIKVPIDMEQFCKKYINYVETINTFDRFFGYKVEKKENSFIIRND